ncbi:FtsX-like permease family protein [Streptomyces orinoci]|uniref:FtsX-like permease family protein n=1 Tax=Streptomyces orinoci TaxID=67339 RepID=A0ABV3K6X1_STRON|nr:FtsX-like permease family protein [Streptomyces orinoci]
MIGKLARRSLRHRIGAFTATFLALVIGAVIVMACGGLMETGIRSTVPPQRLTGADLVVAGDQTYRIHQPGKKHSKEVYLSERAQLPAELTDRIRAVPGVRTAIAERTLDVSMPGIHTNAQAHGWSSAALTPYTLTAGHAPARPGEVVLDQALARRAKAAVGDRLRIAAHGGSAGYTVSGIARGRAPRPTLFFGDAEAVRLSPRPDTVSDIAVRLAPGAHRKDVAAALKGERVSLLTGGRRGLAEQPDALQGGEDLIALAGVFGGLAIAVAMFVVAGTVGLAAQQRRRELALLRAIGAAPGQLRRMLLGESLAVMVAAAAVAWPLGPVVGRWLFERMTEHGMVADAMVYRHGWIPALPAYGALLLTTVAGTLLGTGRAVNARPVEALGEVAVPQRWLTPLRLVLGLLFLAGTVALGLVTALVLRGPVAASTAGPTVMCCAIGLALLGPWFVKLVTMLLYWPVRLFTGAAGRLAAVNCRVSAVKTAAVATPLMLASAIATGMLYLQTGVQSATDRAAEENLRADAVLTSAAGGLDPALVDDVRRLPGVGAAGASVSSRVYTERPHDGEETKRGLAIEGVDGTAAERTLAIRPVAGSLRDLRGATLALPERMAHRMGRGLGDTVRLRLGDGAVTDVRIVALFPAREGYESALTSVELLAPHTTEGLPGRILIRAADGFPRDRLMTELGELAARHPGVRAGDRDAVLDRQARDSRTQAWVNYLIVGMLVAYTALSVVNSTAVAVGNRRRDFALQRLTGATRGQVLRMMTVEGLLVAVVGLTLGTVAAATTLLPFGVAVGAGCRPSGPGSIYGVVVGAAVALTLTATLVPTWLALRGRPVHAAAAA